ncbi:MAG: hypothetical protein KDD47_28225 [Acidobacteria bacterium]|nr:hypothetical protein [Acidobacteriota bacterium]
MLGQLLFTFALAFALAEGMSRWLLEKSFWASVVEIFEDPATEERVLTPEDYLEVLVRERRQTLAAARRRARQAREPAAGESPNACAEQAAEAKALQAEVERRLLEELEDRTVVLG